MTHRPSLRRLRANSRGSAVVEFAFASPLIVAVIFGALQVSMLLYANGTMRSALGEGARFATTYRTPATATGWAGPTATQICTRVEERISSMQNAEITALTLTRGTNGGADALTLAMSYNVDLDWIFFTTSPTLTETRRVYVQSQPDFGDTFNCLT
jgi:Flp pilus assembly protein TadG